MHGWIKLKEKILQTDDLPLNVATTSSINGHTLRSNDKDPSSPSILAGSIRSPSVVSLVSSDDETVSDSESTPSVISSSSPSPVPVSLLQHQR